MKVKCVPLGPGPGNFNAQRLVDLIEDVRKLCMFFPRFNRQSNKKAEEELQAFKDSVQKMSMDDYQRVLRASDNVWQSIGFPLTRLDLGYIALAIEEKP